MAGSAPLSRAPSSGQKNASIPNDCSQSGQVRSVETCDTKAAGHTLERRCTSHAARARLDATGIALYSGVAMGVSYLAVIVPKRRTLVPTSEQLAEFVEEIRRSKWTHACFHRPAARVRMTVARGVKGPERERDLPDPLTPEGVNALRRATAPDAVADELCIRFAVFWGTERVPRHVLAEHEDDPEDDDDILDDGRILTVENEHPHYYDLELRIARDLVETWGNTVDNPAETRCACGELLSYDASAEHWPALRGQHVRAICKKCSRRHDPADDPPTRVMVDSGYERARADVKPTPREHTHLATHFSVVLDFEKDHPVLPAGQYLTVDPDFLQLCERVFGEPFEVVNVFI
jgi:hypothetical protein